MWSRIATIIGLAIACSPLPTTKPICTPGQSIACSGVASCSGYQVCADDGTSFGDCICEAPDASIDSASDVVDATFENDQQTPEAEAGPMWTPASLGSALVIWFEADTGFSTTSWKDQSGNGNDAKIMNPLQGTFQQYGNELNGHSAIKCPGNGTFLYVNDSTSLHWGTGEWTLVFVTKMTSGDCLLWQQDNGTSTSLSVTGSSTGIDERVGNTGDALLATQNSSKYHAFIARGPHLTIASDEGTFANGPTVAFDMSNVGSGISFGSTGNFGVFMIAEIIGIHGTMSNADSIALGTYLHEKYAF